jgi:hypothetical protein
MYSSTLSGFAVVRRRAGASPGTGSVSGEVRFDHGLAARQAGEPALKAKHPGRREGDLDRREVTAP